MVYNIFKLSLNVMKIGVKGFIWSTCHNETYV